MFGLLLTFFGTGFEEASAVISKDMMKKHRESTFTVGFLHLFSGCIVMILLVLFTSQQYVFALASLPIFATRLMFEILQIRVVVRAIERADRSTFSFLRLVTIPLLLIVDIILGYTIGWQAILGMLIIFFGVAFVVLDGDFNKKGSRLVLLGAVNAAITISLYKYNLEHYNSVPGEMLTMYPMLMIYFYFLSRAKGHEHPIAMLKHRIIQKQTFATGIGAVLTGYAYDFAPASIITTAKRGMSVFWSILSGQHYFHEKHILLKLITMLFFVCGLALLALG